MYHATISAFLVLAAITAAFYRACLKHCTRQPSGGYLGGLGDLSELAPARRSNCSKAFPACRRCGNSSDSR